MIRDNIMSQIDLPADFDFQRAGREVLDIEREGLAQLDHTLMKILPVPVRPFSAVPVKLW